MTVRELYNKISEFCPKRMSCSWDNDGIMLSGNLDAEVKSILTALDATEETLCYAAENGYDVLLTHHPMLFRGVKSVSPDTPHGRRVIKALDSGLSVLSFHTRLDACDGGVNDELCRVLGLHVSGKFGDDECEELGRFCECDMTARELSRLVLDKLGCDAVRLNGDKEKRITRVGVCGGDGKEMIYPALMSGCDALITGDAGYNIAGDAAEDGIVVIEAGHYHTEAPVCRVLASLAKSITGIKCGFYNSCTYTVITK